MIAQASGRGEWRFRRLAIETLEDRRLLTAVSWIGGTTGYWDVGTNWSGGAVPTSTADVTIQAGDAESVNSATVATGNTLLIIGGSLTTAAGLSNNGTINESAGCTVTVGGSYTAAAGAAPSTQASARRSSSRDQIEPRPSGPGPLC